MKTKQGYQKTKLGWIPVDWEVRKISDIVQTGRKISYGIVQTGEPVENGIRCIRVLDLNSGGIQAETLIRTSEEISDSYKKTIVRRGDLVIALRGRIGALGIITKELEGVNLTRGVALLAINNENSNLYIYQQLSSSKGKVMLERKLSGSALKELSIGVLRKVEVVLPPLPEQKKIAKILSTWDTAITKTKALIEKKQELKKGLMQVLLTGKVRFGEFVSEEGTKKSKLGLIPKDWEVVKLAELGVVISGLTYKPSDINEKGVLVLRSSNVQKRRLLYNNNVHIDVKKSNFNPVVEKDILICVRNGSKSLIGKNALITKEIEGCAFGAFMSIFRSDYNMYIFQLFDTEYYYKEIYKNLGATINSINGGNLKKMKFPMPQKKEQKKIAKVLSTCDQAIQKLNEQLAELQAQKKGLMQQLLTGATRVKVEA